MITADTNRPQSDPLHHTANIKDMLEGAARHCREDIAKIDEPKAQALFETTAEVLEGLIKAYNHYEVGAEAGMRR